MRLQLPDRLAKRIMMADKETFYVLAVQQDVGTGLDRSRLAAQRAHLARRASGRLVKKAVTMDPPDCILDRQSPRRLAAMQRV